MTIRSFAIAAAAVLATAAVSVQAQTANSPPRTQAPVGQPMVTMPAGQVIPKSTSSGQDSAASPTVRNAQQQLAAMGHDPGPQDGMMGPRTRDAVRSFQQAKGIAVTGELDAPTRDALGTGRK